MRYGSLCPDPGRMNDTFFDWPRLYAQPFDKHSVDPYTRARMILMNGTEFEAIWFTRAGLRHCATTRCGGTRAHPPRRTAAAKADRLLKPRRRDHSRTHHRLRAARRGSHRSAGADGGRRVRQARARFRPFGGLRPPLPLRRPAGYGDRRQGGGHRRPLYGDHARPPDHRPPPPPLRFHQKAHRPERRPCDQIGRGHHHRRRTADDELLYERLRPLPHGTGAQALSGDRHGRGTARLPVRQPHGRA